MPALSTQNVLAACPWLPGFRSDDLGEVRRFYGEIDGARARVPHSREPMGCLAHLARGPRIGLGSTSSRVGLTARWVVPDPVFQITVPTGCAYRTGRQTFEVNSPASVVFVPPAWEWARVTPPGLVLAAQVKHDALRGELLAQRPDGGGEVVPRLRVREIDPARHARLQEAVACLAWATKPGSSPRQMALAEARLLAELAQLLPDPSGRHEAAQMSEQRVRDLEGWIDANLGEPISLGRLCDVAGVGARCLQRTFEQRRGMSPMRFVAERRLAATHRALLNAAPGASVTQIALDHGFDHVGRFAQLYQQVLGELPSHTLSKQRLSRDSAASATVTKERRLTAA